MPVCARCGEHGTMSDVATRRPKQDWVAWHAAYDDPNSALSWRLAVTQARIRSVLDGPPDGPIRAVSLCAGQGRDLIGALVGHPRRGDLRGRLVELDPHNAAAAARLVRESGLSRIEVVTADAAGTVGWQGSSAWRANGLVAVRTGSTSASTSLPGCPPGG